jgi:hypothetical protein
MSWGFRDWPRPQSAVHEAGADRGDLDGVTSRETLERRDERPTAPMQNREDAEISGRDDDEGRPPGRPFSCPHRDDVFSDDNWQ